MPLSPILVFTASTIATRRAVRATTFVVLAACSLAVLAPKASALPPGRTYEMVSPLYKGGYSASTITAVAPDGASVAYGSLGSFNGDPSNNGTSNYYLARRGVNGWNSVPVVPAATLGASYNVLDFSRTLDSSLSEILLGSNSGQSEFTFSERELLMFLAAESNFALVGEPLKALDGKPFGLKYMGSNANLSAVALEGEEGKPLLSNASPDVGAPLYSLRSQPRTGELALSLVGLNNKRAALEPACRIVLGSASQKDSTVNAVSAEGAEIFFTVGVGGACTNQVFARIGGEHTVEVSRAIVSSKGLPLPCVEVPCEGASKEAETRAPGAFEGASEDGGRVYFTTSQSLTQGDENVSSDLYLATVGCQDVETCEPALTEVLSLREVSSLSQNADVQGVVSISTDGNYAYFVAHGILSTNLDGDSQSAVTGADNLYVYNASTDSTLFIGDLCSGHERSGEVRDAHCPSSESDANLWESGDPAAQLNHCYLSSIAPCEPGRFIVFDTAAQLDRGDTDRSLDVYRYDALLGTIRRVSLGEHGYDANGNKNLCGAAKCEAFIPVTNQTHAVNEAESLNGRAISSDGAHVVFTTNEPLSSQASNGLTDVYEWAEDTSEGEVSLVSSGTSDEPDQNPVVSEDDADIFFKTTQALLPQDNDNQYDIYDARAGAPLVATPSAPHSCSGDACQGPLTDPAPILVPASAEQEPEEDSPTPAPHKSKKPARRTKAHRSKRNTRHAVSRAKRGSKRHR